jgi:uncharacterized protein
MTDEENNVAVLKDAYRRWSETLGGSAEHWLTICDPDILFGSIAQGQPQSTSYFTEYRSRDALRDYFAGLDRDWQMMEFAAEHFVAQGDRVVMLGRCAFRYRKTGKVVWTHKVDSWRFANGKAVEFFEYFDTAQVHAAVNAPALSAA